MMKVLALLVVALALCNLSEANSGGYPVCGGAFGGGGPHGTNNLAPTLTITPAITGTYAIATKYTLTIAGGDFTGFSLYADKGTMAVVDATTTQLGCGTSGVTHKNKNTKATVTATWTPPAGGGDVNFYTVTVAGGGGANYGNKATAVKGPTVSSSSSSTGTKSSSSSTAKSSSSSTAEETSDSSSSEPEPVVTVTPDVWVDLTLNLNVYATYPTQEDFEVDFIPELATLLNIEQDRITIAKYSAPTATKTKPNVNVALTVKIDNKDYPDEPVAADDVQTALEGAQEEATGTTLAAIVSYKAYTDSGNNNAGSPSQPSKMSSTAIAAIIVVVLVAVLGGAGGYWYCKKRASGGNMKATASNISSAPSSAQTSTDGWTKVWDENTKHYYYFNSKTSESRWTPPPGVTF